MDWQEEQKIYVRAGKKTRIFCFQQCREQWWKENPDKIKKKAVYEYTCAYCGNKFEAYGNKNRKYYYTVRYIRLPDLLLDLQAARDNGSFTVTLKKYTKPVLLIIDEWLLLKLTESEARNLFELIHKRHKKSSTIFCSQFRENEWYQQISSGERTLADAIMDRISYDSYKIDIESIDPSKDLSMREVYGLDPAQAK